MSSDLEIHKKISQLSKKRVLDHYIRADYNDLVNEAYLRVLEGNGELNLDNLTKAVNLISGEWRAEYSDYNEKKIAELQFVFCKKCKEDKPIASFGIIIRKKTGRKELQSKCSDCQRKVMEEHNRKRGIQKTKINYLDYPPKLNLKEKNSFRHKVWQHKNKIVVRNYQKNRDKKERENLTDAYIRKLLNKKYATKYLLDNPNIVIEHRENLLIKREKFKKK